MPTPRSRLRGCDATIGFGWQLLLKLDRLVHLQFEAIAMLIRFTKHAGKEDWMECIRTEGTSTRCPMPKQGILPHDFVHYVVEDTLNLRRGFYGILAIGVGFPNSAPPWDAADFELGDLTEALQAESLVECFQAEMWNGFEASEHFWEILRITCSQRYVAAPTSLTLDDLQRVRSRLQAYTEQWEALAIGEMLEVEFKVGAIEPTNLSCNDDLQS